MNKKILLCWNYERKSWVTQFEQIFQKGECVYINVFSKDLEKSSSTSERILYWNDFKSVDHLVDEIDPAKVIFMGLDSPYAFLLNYVCKERGIKTYFLQHGIFHAYKAYLYEEASMRKILGEQKKTLSGKLEITPKDISKVQPVRNNHFFLHSFRMHRLGLYYRIIKYVIIKKTMHSVQKALKAVAGEPLQADHYIVYTKYLSRIFRERDNVNPEKMIEIGNEEANEIILDIVNTKDYSYSGGDYFLFIDEAFTGAEEFLLSPIVAKEEHNKFLLLLSEYARSKCKRLLVKLHPFSYNVDHFIEDDNITYVKHTDIKELIKRACGIFGFSSTLLIPSIYLKKACIFKLNEFSDIHKALIKINYCKVLNFHDFKLDDIGFNEVVTAEQKAAFIEYFLYRVDDACSARLKHILESK